LHGIRVLEAHDLEQEDSFSCLSHSTPSILGSLFAEEQEYINQSDIMEVSVTAVAVGDEATVVFIFLR
jgi:hypothetical protein